MLEQAVALLANPVFSDWAKQRGFVRGDFTGTKNLYDQMRDDDQAKQLSVALHGAAQADRPGIERLLRGAAVLTGTPWTADQQKAVQTISGDFAKIAPVVYQAAPELYDTLLGKQGSVMALAGAIAQASPDMSGDDALTRAKGLHEKLYDGDVMRTRGFSAYDMGKIYRELTKRGVIAPSTSSDDISSTLQNYAGPVAALRDSFADQKVQPSIENLFSAYDKIPQQIRSSSTPQDLEAQIRVGRALQRDGGAFSMATRHEPYVPGRSTEQLTQDGEQILQQAATSPHANMLAATDRMQAAQPFDDAGVDDMRQRMLQGDELSISDWLDTLDQAGVPRGTAQEMLSQQSVNQSGITPEIADAAAKAYANSLPAQALPGTPMQNELARGSADMQAQRAGFTDQQHMQSVTAPMQHLPAVRQQATQQAQAAQQMSGIGQTDPLRRTMDAVHTATPQTNWKDIGAKAVNLMKADSMPAMQKAGEDKQIGEDAPLDYRVEDLDPEHPRYQDFVSIYPHTSLEGTSAILAAMAGPYIAGGALARKDLNKYEQTVYKKHTPEAILSSFYVHPEHRGHGLGSKLLEELLSRYNSLGLTTDSTGDDTSPEAVHLYERLGFKPIKPEKRQTYWHWARPEDNVKAGMTVSLDDLTGDLREELEKTAARRAPGIPDRRYFGDPGKLKAGEIKDLIVQLHMARRAGLHRDIRMGDQKGLFSWASRMPMPAAGGKTLAIMQPMHSYEHGDFEGEIPMPQYGAGTVKREDKGRVLITAATSDKIEFVRADKKFPERFVLIKPKGFGREKDWLLINTTPKEFDVPREKVHYKRIPAAQVEEQIAKMQEGDSLEVKRDGANTLIELMDHGAEVISYRTSTTGRPIIHTEKMLPGRKFDVPKELVGTVLRGETFGQRDGDVIHPQELGGLLNSTVENALKTQQEKGIKLRNMVFDILRRGKQDVDFNTVPRDERRRMLQEIMPLLPDDVFELSESATTPDEAKALWERVKQTGYTPATEGVVFHPRLGKPAKAKLLEDNDVYIRNIFPGGGKYEGTGAGGFEYSLTPDGDVVGRVGTGFNDDMRRRMWQNPQEFVGRVARIHSQQQYPSGAYRAPAMLALHEDVGAPEKEV